MTLLTIILIAAVGWTACALVTAFIFGRLAAHNSLDEGEVAANLDYQHRGEPLKPVSFDAWLGRKL